MVIGGLIPSIRFQSMKPSTMILMGMDMEITSLEPTQMLALNQQVNQPEIDSDVWIRTWMDGLIRLTHS